MSYGIYTPNSGLDEYSEAGRAGFVLIAHTTISISASSTAFDTVDGSITLTTRSISGFDSDNALVFFGCRPDSSDTGFITFNAEVSRVSNTSIKLEYTGFYSGNKTSSRSIDVLVFYPTTQTVSGYGIQINNSEGDTIFSSSDLPLNVTYSTAPPVDLETTRVLDTDLTYVAIPCTIAGRGWRSSGTGTSTYWINYLSLKMDGKGIGVNSLYVGSISIGIGTNAVYFLQQSMKIPVLDYYPYI